MQLQQMEESVISRLRNFGHRITSQKRIIIKNILNNPDSTIKEIYYLSKKTAPDLNLSTVYRTIKSLEAVGFLGSRNINFCLSNVWVGGGTGEVV